MFGLFSDLWCTGLQLLPQIEDGWLLTEPEVGPSAGRRSYSVDIEDVFVERLRPPSEQLLTTTVKLLECFDIEDNSSGFLGDLWGLLGSQAGSKLGSYRWAGHVGS